LEDFTNEIIGLYNALRAEKDSFKELGVDLEEKSFYDILKALMVKYDFNYPEDKLINLSRKVKAVVDDKTKYTDWSKRDDIKAELKADLIILLAENDYPPVDRDEVYKEIFDQAENFKKRNKITEPTTVSHKGHLYLDTDDYLTAENVFYAYKSFGKSLGFKFIDDGEVVKGSWVKKGVAFVQRVFKSEEAIEVFDKGKKALELVHLDKVQSEVNKNNAEAAKALMEAVKDVPNVAMAMGSLIVVKTIIDGESKVMIRNLTMNQLIQLDKNPDLLNKPFELMNRLKENNLLN